MAKNNWPQVKEIIAAALEVGDGEREAFLNEQCAGDPELRAEVDSLLSAHEELDGFIEQPVFKVDSVFVDEPDRSGRRFGNYQIVRQIGAGGMGAVFLAERIDGEFEQRVAVKIIRQALAETELINRFKRERQILASLNHPSIARLLDGGVANDGTPFLVMEFVEGEAITKSAEQNKLNLEARLRLFLEVCAAVAYAHRNLVIHRDLKPNNIFVDREGQAKLLDFGLAKLTEPNANDSGSSDRLDSEEFTQTAFRALTPAYASPEQIKGSAITTASDIYSLGVVLYELLTGCRPFHFEGKSLEEVIRAVTVAEPPLPSSVSGGKSSQPNAKLRGDLDNIILMALRKEPERRYRSVEKFADDIDRYLKGLPVAARKNSPRYRAGKFVKRNKFAVAAAALIILSLVGGIFATSWQARQAKREKVKAEKISAFLEQTLRYSNAVQSSLKKNGPEATVSEAVDEAARRLDGGEFDDTPEVKAELERTIASIYFTQSKFPLARKHLEQNMLLLDALYGQQDPRFISSGVLRAGLLFAQGELAQAEQTYRRFFPLLRQEYRRGNITVVTLAEAANNFAYLRRTQGDSKEAEMLFRETLEYFPLLPRDALDSVATTRSTLASTLSDQGRFDEAVETARVAVDEYRQRGDVGSTNYGFSLTIFGGFLAEKGHFAEADASLQEAEAIFRRLVPPGSLWVGDNYRQQANSLLLQGRFALAQTRADQAIKIYQAFGKHYDQYPTALIIKGLALTKQGHAAEAEPLLREALKVRTDSLPKDHFWVAIANSAWGEWLVSQKRYPEAEPFLVESSNSLNVRLGPQDPRTISAYRRLLYLYEVTGRTDLAGQIRPKTV